MTERRKMDLIYLSEFAGGSLQEKADAAMREVLENMQNPNTPWKAERQINIKLSFEQNMERDDATVEVSVSTKLAPVSPVLTRMAIGRDLRDGKVYVEEYGKQIRGQMSFGDLLSDPKGPESLRIGEDEVDPGTGEVVTENKVIDLRKAAVR